MDRPPGDERTGGAPQLRLRPPRNLVSPRARGYWAVRALPGWLVLAVAQVVVLVIGLDNQVELHLALLAATLVVAAAHLAVMPQWRYRVHRWEATDQALYTQAGWFSQQRRIAPISRIQTVDSERGPIEQLFGLTNVTVTTASAAGPLRIHGLERDQAQILVDDLAHAAEATRGDAT
jgi:membrane protein YdbS with pleckstrin-like domain